MKFTIVCISENVTTENLHLNENESLIAVADRLIKYSDMFEGFKIITFLSILGYILYGVSMLITQWG